MATAQEINKQAPIDYLLARLKAALRRRPKRKPKVKPVKYERLLLLCEGERKYFAELPLPELNKLPDEFWKARYNPPHAFFSQRNLYKLAFSGAFSMIGATLIAFVLNAIGAGVNGMILGVAVVLLPAATVGWVMGAKRDMVPLWICRVVNLRAEQTRLGAAVIEQLKAQGLEGDKLDSAIKEVEAEIEQTPDENELRPVLSSTVEDSYIATGDGDDADAYKQIFRGSTFNNLHNQPHVTEMYKQANKKLEKIQLGTIVLFAIAVIGALVMTVAITSDSSNSTPPPAEPVGSSHASPNNPA